MDDEDRKSTELRTGVLGVIGDMPAGHLSLAAWRRIAKAVEREVDRERVAEGGVPGFEIVPKAARRRVQGAGGTTASISVQESS